MRILHTSDWHVGRSIRGRSRADEHRAVLAEIVTMVQEENVDVVLVAGDQFDVSSPTAEAESIVYGTLQDLAATGAQVVVVGGNHDSWMRWDALRPIVRDRVHIVGQLARPSDGGVVSVTAADGTEGRVAVVPFVSQRGIVRADDLLNLPEHEHTGMYAARMQAIVRALADAAFSADTVNIITGHMTVVSGEQPQVGGGERNAHTVFDYYVSPQVFPANAQYVALGHLHKMHQVPGPAPTWYCGAPLHMDFGESGGRYVLLVDVEPGKPAKVRPVELSAGRPLVTLRGTFDEVCSEQVSDDAWVRIVLDEARRTGLADEIREKFPNAVDIRIEPSGADRHEPEREPVDFAGMSTDPGSLFATFCAEQGIEDSRVAEQFAKVLADHAERQSNAGV